MSKTDVYKVWAGMKYRCKSKKESHESWSGRGITVCKEWQSFIPFFEWSMNSGYKKGLTLDRINNDGNYEPSNCRFTTYSVQNSNKRPYRRMPR